MRLVRVVCALLCLGAWLAPTSALAHDGVSGTPDVTIRITGAGVSDPSVSVPVGGIVAFVNQDDERHRMRSRTEPGEFDTGDIEPGQRNLVRFSTEGSVRYADERTERSAFSGTIEVRATSSSGGSGSGSAGSGGMSGGGSTTNPSLTASITIGDRIFTPGTVTIATGGTVTWTNRDDREHTATSTGGGTISSPVLSSGQAYRKTFAQPGTFAFLCSIHPEMRGTVKVVASGTATAGGAATPIPSPKPTPAPSTPPVTAPGVVEAGIVDFGFQPTPITIAAGDTVTWVNRGAAPHTVTASDGAFDSSLIEAGGSFSRQFASPGSYAFVCSFHPEMQGVVTVTAASTVAGAASPDPAARSSPSPTSSPTPGPTESAGPAAAVLPPASAEPATPVEAAPVASVSDPASTFGQLVVVGMVVSLNVGAVLLFAKAIGGAMRKPA